MHGIIPAINYSLNYHYYAEVLCENKESPEKHCEGKCQLVDDIEREMDQSGTESALEYSIPFFPGVVHEVGDDDLDHNYLRMDKHLLANDRKVHSLSLDVITPPPLV